MITTEQAIPSVARRRHALQKPHRAVLSAIYIGTMPGFEHLPSIELYNLLVPVGEHPVGSTVSRSTLEKHGLRLPHMGTSRPGSDADRQVVDLFALQLT